jgi:hypothetical protein
MIRFSAVIVVTMLVSQLTYAQAPSQSDSSSNHRPDALQFQIGQNFTLQSFQGATISYKHHTDRLSAYRFGISLSFGGSNTDNESSGFALDTLQSALNGPVNQTSASISLNAQRLWYLDNPTDVLMFIGTGPYVGFSRSSTHSETSFFPVDPHTRRLSNDLTYTSWSAGLSGVLGVEWFTSRLLSLHAEYFANVGYSWAKTENITDSSTPGYRSEAHSTTTTWQLSGQGVRFGLSVYF